ncbi:MAG: AraC family transcriptional regulator [Hellea sp.]
MGSLADIVIDWRSALMFALCLPMLVASIMLMTRRVERRANLFLGGLLIAVVIVQIPQIIGFSQFYSIWPGLTFFPFDTELYLGPLFYLHAWALTHDKPLRWRWGLLIPGLLQTLYYTAAFFALGDYKNKWAYNEAVHDPFITPIETVLAIGFILAAIYFVSKMMKTYNMFLIETQSAKIEYDPIWLRRLNRAFIVAGCIFLIFRIVDMTPGGLTYRAGFPIQLIMTAIIAWLGFEALSRTSRPFPKIYTPSAEPLDEAPPKARDWVKDGAALKAAIQDEKLYLSPTLSLKGLASRMNSNETYMSRAINLGLDTNFNRLINQMRVAHAKDLLASTSENILAIALESGFNSKPTFNRVFRDISGQTPTAYRQQSATGAQ